MPTIQTLTPLRFVAATSFLGVLTQGLLPRYVYFLNLTARTLGGGTRFGLRPIFSCGFTRFLCLELIF